VAGEGVEQVEIRLRVVDHVPVEVPHEDLVEQPALLDLLAVVGQLAGRGRPSPSRRPSPISS
jgi:hypothetical protein